MKNPFFKRGGIFIPISTIINGIRWLIDKWKTKKIKREIEKTNDLVDYYLELCDRGYSKEQRDRIINKLKNERKK